MRELIVQFYEHAQISQKPRWNLIGINAKSSIWLQSIAYSQNERQEAYNNSYWNQPGFQQTTLGQANVIQLPQKLTNLELFK